MIGGTTLAGEIRPAVAQNEGMRRSVQGALVLKPS
jgi:hypothetical protein